MRGIVIAAGLGTRMRPHTDFLPKCMLDVAGRPLLDWAVEGLRHVGCNEIVVVTGHCAEKIQRADILRVRNENFRENNVLHSLMCASDYLTEAVMVSYSDIWVEPEIYSGLASAEGDIVLAVDRDWQAYYEGRTEHPVQEAEKIYFDADMAVRAAGKHLAAKAFGRDQCGEFLGLWKMTTTGASKFASAFNKIDERLPSDKPFEHAPRWRSAYITDLIQNLVNAGTIVKAYIVERGWAELDTTQDYERLPRLAEQQKLKRLTAALKRKDLRND